MIHRLAVRLDATHEIGFGHAVRCAALMNRLRDVVDPVIIGRGRGLNAVFPNSKIMHLEDENCDWLALLENVKPVALLVDLPRRAHRPWLSWRKLGVPIIALDDEGGALDADLIINGTVLPDYHQYEAVGRFTRICSGPQFALLRSEFSASTWSAAERRALVLVGSGERAESWAFKITGAGLEELFESTNLVVGEAFSDFEALRSQASSHGISVHRGLKAGELASMLARSSVALMTGGMVVYEALAVGTPIVAYPQVENLIPEMQFFASQGCLINLGFEGGEDLRAVRAALMRLTTDVELAKAQSLAGRSIVDGMGIHRIAAIVTEELNLG